MARQIIAEFEEAQIGGPVAAESLYRLGLRYATGRGVDRDNVVAHKWFNLAAMRGCAGARDERKALADEMTRDEVAEAQRQAREWLDSLN